MKRVKLNLKHFHPEIYEVFVGKSVHKTGFLLSSKELAEGLKNRIYLKAADEEGVRYCEERRRAAQIVYWVGWSAGPVAILLLVAMAAFS